MSSSHGIQHAPGTPAVYHAVHDTAFNLPALAEVLAEDQPDLIWLDSARLHPVTGRYSILGWDPWLTFSCTGQTVRLTSSAGIRRQRGHPLHVLRQTLRRYPGPEARALPPIGVGLLGCFSYELNQWIERLPSPKPTELRFPVVLLFGMRMLVVVDHLEGRSWCLSVVDPHQPVAQAHEQARKGLDVLHELVGQLAARTAPELATPGGPSTSALTTQPAISQRHFEDMVHVAKDYIRAGDIFQANLAQPFGALWNGSTWPLYRALREINPSPFACFLKHRDWSIVSCSPERLVVVREGTASARPIAGTRPRGTSPEEDVVNSLELILSDKERAEHIMLVDLARNDLGRICRYGSVHADEVMGLEDYSHVIHIVSNVRGRLREEVDAVEVIRAMFPGGTITGCPKVRAMEIIHELEPCARGPYTGSMGVLGFDGSVDLNILIRTMVTRRNRLWFHVGAGIVADSQPDREYEETLAKAAALIQALQATASKTSAPYACVH